ncbi:hypothetical protein [Denitratimonas sp. CY0512]|uniref:hypothetical protein n=1 Tax=Denitratimonas sp. CY0512 TaxID=3131940 RepID=UPI00309EC551
MDSFKNGKLYINEAKRGRITVVRGWPDLRAWTRTRTTSWRCSRIAAEAATRCVDRAGHWQLLMRSKEVIRQHHAISPGMPIPFSLHADCASSRAMLAFTATFPPQVLARAAIFGQRRWHVLCLQARVPGADELLFHNPALAWMLASNWVFRDGRGSGDAMRNARRWVGKRQPEILSWMGFSGSRRLARIVREVEPQAVSVPAMLYLRNASWQSECMEALQHLQRLDASALRIATDPTLLSRVTPRFLQQLDVEPAGDAHRTRAWKLRELLEHETALTVQNAPLPRRIDTLAQMDECLHRFAHGADVHPPSRSRPPAATTLPIAPWPGTKHIQPIADTDALMLEGEQMQHCVADYWRRIVSGDIAVYRVLAPVRATLAVQRRHGEWQPMQIAGFDNAAIDRTAAAQIMQALRQRKSWPGEEIE